MPIVAPPRTPTHSPPAASNVVGKVGADQVIDTRIREACRALWWAEIVRTCLRLVILSIGVLLTWVAIDQWVYSPGTGVRVALFLAACVGSVWYVWRRIVPLMGSSIRPEYAARSLERDLPELRQSLTSYVTLRGERDATGLRSRVVRSIGSVTAGRLRSHDELPAEATGTIRWWIATAVALALLVAYAAVSPKNALQSAARLIAPVASIDPAKRVSIREVQPGDVEAIAGRTVEISAEISGMRSDEEAFCRWDLPSGREQILLSKAPDSRKHAGGLWLPHSVSGEVAYVITAGDAEAGPYRLRVQDVPVVALQSVHYEPPSYTGQTPHTSSSGAITPAIDGTRVKILATTNRAVAKAKIEFNPRALGDLIRATAGATEMEIDSEGTTLSVSFPLRSARGRSAAVELESYRITVWDAADQHNPDPIIYPIRVVADLPPEVSITMPLSSPKDVPIDAQQIIEVHASDPDFGLQKIALEIRSGIDLIGEPILWSDPQGAKGNRVTEYRFRPTEQGLRIRDTVRIIAVATDNRSIPQDQSVEPNVTRTDPVELKITASQPLPDEGDPNAGGLSPPDDRPPSDRSSQDQDSSSQGGQQGDQGQSGSGGGKSGEQQSGDSQSGEDPTGGGQSGDSKGQQGEGQQGEGQQGEGQSGEGQSGEGQSGEGQSGEQEQSGQNDSSPDGGGKGSSGQQDASSQGSAKNDDTQTANDADSQNQAGQGDEGSSKGTGQPRGQDPGSKDGSASGGQMQDGQSGDAAPSGQDSASPPGQSDANQRAAENGQGGDDASRPQGGASSDSTSPEGGANESGTGQESTPSAPKHDGETFERIRDHLEKKQQELQKQDEGSGSEQTPGDSSETSSGEKESSREQKSGTQQDPQSEGAESSRTDSDSETSGKQGESQDQPASGWKDDSSAKSGQPDKSTESKPQDSATSADASGDDSGSGSDADKGSDQAGQTPSGQSGDAQQKPDGSQSGQDGSEQSGSGDQSGSGEAKDGSSESGSQPSPADGGKQPTGSAKNGSPQDDAQEGAQRKQSANQNDPEGSAGKQSGDQTSPSGAPKSPPSDSGAGAGEGGDGSGESDDSPVRPDPVNVEYAKKATDLVLDYLEQTREAPDQELLENLDWTQDDLNRFADRWQKVRDMEQASESDPALSRDVEEALKSLGLRPSTEAANKVRESGDSLRRIRDAGNRQPPPAAYRDAFDAFRRAVGQN